MNIGKADRTSRRVAKDDKYGRKLSNSARNPTANPRRVIDGPLPICILFRST